MAIRKDYRDLFDGLPPSTASSTAARLFDSCLHPGALVLAEQDTDGVGHRLLQLGHHSLRLANVDVTAAHGVAYAEVLGVAGPQNVASIEELLVGQHDVRAQGEVSEELFGGQASSAPSTAPAPTLCPG